MIRGGVIHTPDISGETLTTEDLEYVTRIRSQYTFLLEQQKKTVDYILTHPDSGLYSSIILPAKKFDISTVTISRFCQVLSYKGFSKMKLHMNKKTLSSSTENNLIKNNGSLSVVLQKLTLSACDAINDTIRILDPATILNVVNEFLSANIISFYGQSGGYISGLCAKQLLPRVGVLSQAASDNVDMQLAASTLKAGDVAAGIAYSNEVRSVIKATETAPKNGATIAAITVISSSNMAEPADHTLCYSPGILDDLYYLYLRNTYEISILGAVQAEILCRPSQDKYISGCRGVILKGRKRIK